MTRKKLIKTIALSTIGALTIAGIVAVSILSTQAHQYYSQISDYNDKMLVYEKDEDRKYQIPGTPEYEDYQAIKTANIELNKQFNSVTDVLPYLGAGVFLFAGFLVFQGVSALSHSNVRAREN